MKKVLFIALAAAAVTFTGCKNEPATPPVEDQPEVEVISVDSLNAVIEAGDTTAIGNIFTEVQKKIEEIKAIDPAKAQEYLATVQAFLKENAEKIKNLVGETGAVASLVSTVANLPQIEVPDVAGAAAEAVEDAKDAVQDAAANAVDEAKATVDEAAAKAAEKVNDAKEAVENAANNAVDEAKGKAADALNNAADKLRK